MSVTITVGRVPGVSLRLAPETHRILRRWGRDHVKSLKQAYLDGGHQRRGGKPWKPVKRLQPPPTLIRTGRMRRSTSADPIGTRVTFFNSVPYAAYHQFGTPTIPVRKILVVTGRDRAKLAVRLKRQLEAALK